jgi:phage terminase large subunit-like protein
MEIVAADAAGNLGHNPSCVLLDEVISQPNHLLWDAMRTAMGSRTQPLMVAATTAGSDSSSFAGREHAECAKIAEDPDRAPHRFVYMRNVPTDADPWDETQWTVANPALGDFLSIDALRDEALEARNDPSKSHAFRQYRLNQWVGSSHQWLAMDRYDACTGDIALAPDWFGERFDRRPVWCGLDLSARHDLTSWCVLVPPGDGDDMAHMLWRAWIPEGALSDLDRSTAGHASVWARQGWLTVTDGDVIDYERVYAAITEDAERYRIQEIAYDRWCGEPVRQALSDQIGATMVPVEQTYSGMTGPLTELMTLILSGRVEHHGNPLARWCFDNVEVRHAAGNPDLVKIVKPQRDAAGARIDAAVAAALAVGGWKIRGAKARRGTVVGF